MTLDVKGIVWNHGDVDINTLPYSTEVVMTDYQGCVLESDHHGRLGYSEDFVDAVHAQLAHEYGAYPRSLTIDITDWM